MTTLTLCNTPAKIDAVRALLGCAWKATLHETDPVGEMCIAKRNGKASALIKIDCYIEAPDMVVDGIPFRLHEWLAHIMSQYGCNVPVIIVVLLSTEVHFIELKNIPITYDGVMIDDGQVAITFIPTHLLKFVGKVLPIAETEYAHAV